MSRPSFQFYTKDWRSNSKLRRCTPAARGVWIDVLCALHDSDEYGVARYPLRELASEVGASLAHLRELVDKGVLKGDDAHVSEPFIYTPRSGRRDGEPVSLIPAQAGPLWYSSRMVKDEYVNTHRGAGTRFGEAPKPSPTQREGDGPSTSSSSATAVKEKKPSASRARRCPSSFEVTPSMRAAMEAEAPGIDIDRETVGFRDWEFKDAKADWPAAWRRWMRKAQKDSEKRAPAHSLPQSFRQLDEAAAAARHAEFAGRRPAENVIEMEGAHARLGNG